jgi:hypothetical protein
MASLRVFGLLVLFTLIPMAVAEGAETVPPPSLAPATERPDLEKLLASHELAENPMECRSIPRTFTSAKPLVEKAEGRPRN